MYPRRRRLLRGLRVPPLRAAAVNFKTLFIVRVCLCRDPRCFCSVCREAVCPVPRDRVSSSRCRESPSAECASVLRVARWCVRERGDPDWRALLIGSRATTAAIMRLSDFSNLTAAARGCSGGRRPRSPAPLRAVLLFISYLFIYLLTYLSCSVSGSVSHLLFFMY